MNISVTCLGIILPQWIFEIPLFKILTLLFNSNFLFVILLVGCRRLKMIFEKNRSNFQSTYILH